MNLMSLSIRQNQTICDKIEEVNRKDKIKLEKISVDILSGMSFEDVAKCNNISTRTLLRIRQTEDFKNNMKVLKKVCFETAINKASYLSNKAMDALENIVTNNDSNAQSKIQACKVILELAKNNYEYEYIEERINELEKAVKVL